MSLILIASIGLMLAATARSIALLLRVRDRRLALLVVMFSLMTLRQTLALLMHGWRWQVISADTISESAAFLVSIMAVVAVIYIERMITGWHHAEAALRNSERRLRTVVTGAPIVLFAVDQEGVFLLSEGKGLEALGLQPGEVVGRSVFEVYRDTPQILENIRLALRGEEFSSVVPVRGLWFESRYSPLKNHRGEVVGVIGVATDISERMKAEEALRESEARHRAISELTSDYAYAFRVEPDSTTVREWITAAITRITGFSPEEIDARGGWRSLVHPDDSKVAERRRERLLAGQPDVSELRIITKTGEERWLRDFARPVWDESKGRVVRIYGAAQDITERKAAEEALRRSEEQLIQAQKMEAVGRLAGGIAHDFNNMLTAIMGYTEYFMVELDAQDKRRGYVEDIRKTAERAAALTRQLLAFSRRQVLQPRVLDLNAVVGGIEGMIRRLIGGNAELVTSPGPDLGLVKVDPGQIEQVIVNLVINARDAMPQGGKLTIETANVELGKDYARRHVGTTPGPYVMLAVSDTGVGMDAEARSRAFEPFFTTKESGKGTGLGLSSVYGIVKQSGGHIWLYSEPGHGTTVKIYLPRLEQAAGPTGAVPARPQDTHGTETILLVEDDDGVRDVASRILADSGYTVLTARDAGEALEVLDSHESPIDLVVLDVVLPGLSSGELCERLKIMIPSTKILYMSGYTDNAIVQQGAVASGSAFIEKPFAPETLARRVREVLDEKRREEEAGNE